MAKDKTRQVQWGKGERPETTSRFGTSGRGSNGNIKISKAKSEGAILSANLNGKWHHSPLFGDEFLGEDVFIPKAWHYRGKTEASSADNYVVCPSFITWQNYLGLTFSVNIENDNLHGWAWNDDPSWATTELCEVSIDRSPLRFYIKTQGSSAGAAGKDFRLTVFFK